MIVRNDGCTKWVSAIHEDLEPTRHIEVTRLKGIERLHITTPERAKAATKRNLLISERERISLPDDPRTHWNLANSQFGTADYDGCIASFKDFIVRSQSKEEKYLAYMRLADAYKAMRNPTEAEKQLHIAIGLMPFLPDAYFQLAHAYMEMQNWDDAEEYALRGLKLKPMEHRMVVFNPRDYDYNPMMMLARIYYHKNRPDLMLPLLKGCLKIYPDDQKLKRLVADGETEYRAMERALKKAEALMSIKDKKRLKRELDKLPTDIKSHPAIAILRNTNFIKTDTTGRDLIIYCGNTVHQWAANGGIIGGSEEAVLNLSRELAKLGWNVTIYNNCGHRPVSDGPVIYRPFWEWNYRDKQDVVILWRSCRALDAEINSAKIFVDLHDVISPGEFTENRLKRISKIFVKSKFHRSLFPNVPDDMFAIIPNGIGISLLSKGSVNKDPHLLINTSSADRSLDVLPKLFMAVKKRVPEAKLKWAYGWGLFETTYGGDPKKIQWMHETQQAMKDAGIESLGRLSQQEVAVLYQEASILAYPTEFAEIDCISVRKAQAAGCVPVTSDFGALRESVAYGWTTHSSKTKDTWNRPYQFHFGIENEQQQQAWVDFVVRELTTPTKSSTREHMQEQMTEFDWSNIAARWHNILCG